MFIDIYVVYGLIFFIRISLTELTVRGTGLLLSLWAFILETTFSILLLPDIFSLLKLVSKLIFDKILFIFGIICRIHHPTKAMVAIA